MVGLSLATNWLGYGLLAGGLFAAGAIAPPSQAHIGGTAFRVLGVLLVSMTVGYVLACVRWGGRAWQVRGRQITLPTARLALAQLGLSVANWALMGTAMYLLLGGAVAYTTALGVLMAAAIAGVFTPIPAGLGVLEAVYIALLSGTVGQGRVMGAVLAYRALYYLLPLMGGLVLYLLLGRIESRTPRPEDA